MKKCIDIALNCGFTSAGELDCSTIEVRTEVRDMSTGLWKFRRMRI